MRLSDLFSSKVVPFEAVLKRDGEVAGVVTGMTRTSFVTVKNMQRLGEIESMSDIANAVSSILIESIVEWSIEDERGCILPIGDVCDLPLDFAIQIFGGIMSAAGGDPPNFMKGIV